MVRQAVRQAHGPEQSRTICNFVLWIWDFPVSAMVVKSTNTSNTPHKLKAEIMRQGDGA